MAVAVSEAVLSRVVPLVRAKVAVATVSKGWAGGRLLGPLAAAVEVVVVAPAAVVVVAVEAVVAVAVFAGFALAVVAAGRDVCRVSRRDAGAGA